MIRTVNLSSESRNQLVPSPGSPLALESWCMADLESWLCDSTTLLRPSNLQILTNHGSPGGPRQDDLMAKTLPYQQLHQVMHVSVPSPSSGPQAAESPTLYETPLPTTMSSKGFGGPPPYVHVKQEIEDLDYRCHGGPLDSPMNHLQSTLSLEPLIMVKKEGDNNHSCSNSNNEEIGLSRDKIEQVRLLAVEQAAKDIHEACRVLRISPDPTQWSLRDVKSWFLWTANQYGIEPINLQRLPDCLDGTALCSLSEQYFRLQVPNGGDILHGQLEIWRTAVQMQSNNLTNLLPFRPEDSMLDMSTILNQWTNSSSNSNNNNNNNNGGNNNSNNNNSSSSNNNNNLNQPQLSPASFHRMSPQAGSRGVLMETSSASSPDGGQDFSSEGMQSDDEISDESCEMDRSTATAPTGGRQSSHSHIHLWQFLKELLGQPHLFGSCIRWLDRPKGIFKIEDSVRVARLWGKRKNRPAMNYDKLSRSIRQYYKKGIMKKTERSQRLVYQFCHPYGL